jgi:hypothetical protein
MAVSIYITGKKAGEGSLQKNPLYEMLVFNEFGSMAEFVVTRDSVTKKAPANKPGKPYFGHIREDGLKGFRIELYEPGIGKRSNKYSLKGVGREIRTNIQIHIGPGRSEGCFLLTGGIRGKNKFKRAIKSLISEDKKNKVKNPESFIIRVCRLPGNRI